MSKSKLGLLSALVIGINASCFAMSLCENPVVSGAYTNSPTCVPAIETTNQAALGKIGAPYSATPPYVAALEPVIDQGSQRYINSYYYRYINFPVGQTFKWYLNDGDPATQPYLLITPIMQDSSPKLTISLEGFSSSQFADLTTDNLGDSKGSCSGSLFTSYTCPTLNDFLNAIKPLASLLGMSNTVNLLAALPTTQQAINVQSSTTDGTVGAYLSVRYIETCSGGLIAGKMVMTAGHCYYDNDGSSVLWDSANVNKVFVIGNNWQTSPYVAIQDDLTPTSGNIAPGYSEGGDTDYAIVKIKTIPSYQSFEDIQPFQVSSTLVTSPTQYKMYQVGFGQTEPFPVYDSNGNYAPPPKNASPELLTQFYKSISNPVALLGEQTLFDGSSQPKSGNNVCAFEDGVNNLAWICAGNTNEPAGGYGDSGGPLFSVNSDNMWILHGHFDATLGFDQNEIPNQNKPGTWSPQADGFLSTYYLCTNPALKAWVNGLGVTCNDI